MMDTLLKIKYIPILILLPLMGLAQQESKKLTFDLPIEELTKINLVPKGEGTRLSHDYDLTLEDLSKLEVIKQIKVENKVNVNYDFSLEELMAMEIHLVRNEVFPTYDMPLQGLLKLDIMKEFQIVDKLEFSYDLSLDGLMKLTLIAKN